MAIDHKYGHITTEHPGPDDDEPVMLFRAQDALLPALISHYRLLCQAHGCPQHHIDAIDANMIKITRWQQNNARRVRMPNSDRFAARTKGE